MKVIAVDDERHVLNDFGEMLSKVKEITNIELFTDPDEAYSNAKENTVDVAFLDIELYGESGLELAKKLRTLNYKTNIVFVTSYDRYALEAFALSASDYILKPATEEDIRAALSKLRNPVDPRMDSKLYVQTFGNFEVFSNGEPLRFERFKTKELFAYLVSRRGAWCSVREIVAVLWEDKKDSPSLQGLLRISVADLLKALISVNAKDVLLKRRGYLAVSPQNFDCELYRYEQGDMNAINRFSGEFMSQYSWAESFAGHMTNN